MQTTDAGGPMRIEVTVDELRVLAHALALELPAEFDAHWTDAVPATQRTERDAVARDSLAARGLLDAHGSPTSAGSAVSGFLRLHSEPGLRVLVHAWSQRRTVIQTISVVAGFATSLVRTQRLDEHGEHPEDEDAVEFCAFASDGLVAETLRALALTTEQQSGSAAASVVLPMTAAQALVEAHRTGGGDIVEGVARQIGLADAAATTQGLAFAIDAGYRVELSRAQGSDAFTWLRTRAGWFELGVALPDDALDGSPVLAADAGLVSIASMPVSAIAARVTVAIGTLMGVLHG